MTSFLTRSHGAEVAINVDDILEKKARIEGEITKAEASLAAIQAAKDEESEAARARESFAQDGVDDFNLRRAECEAAVADHRSQIESLHKEIAAREQVIADIEEQVEAERRVQQRCEEQRDAARAELAGVDLRYARKLSEAQKLVDKYRLRLERLRIRMTRIYRFMKPEQKAQIKEAKEAQKTAAELAPEPEATGGDAP